MATKYRAKGEGEKPNPERLKARERRQERLIITWAIIIGALALAGVLAYALWPRGSPYVGFAQCVSDHGAVMYGTDWCAHCQAQKRLFGTAFKQVAFINCDYSQACADHNVTGYPTWIFSDQSRLEGEQPMQALADKTGCKLPG